MRNIGAARTMLAAILGLALAFGAARREKLIWEDDDLSEERRWAPIISPWLLPFFLLALTALLWRQAGAAAAAETVFSLCVDVFFTLSVYYSVLLCLLPLLRRVMSERTVSQLWLLPNFLYLCVQPLMRTSSPRLVLRVGTEALRTLLRVWGAGAAGLMGWYLLNHLLFRRRLLSAARQPEREILARRWEEEQLSAGLRKAKLPLMISSGTRTPLSVGLFRRSTVLLLPREDYSEEELSLILRHELIHILREDSQTKLFLAFCRCICWFNPLVWLAMRRCGEDLELSCDEFVLEDAAEAERTRYAELLLSTAGDERGFTTCLSADARALRYRLRGVMAPNRKKPLGAVLAGVVFALMLICSGYTALSYGNISGEELLFDGNRAENELNWAAPTYAEGNRWQSREITDMEAFNDYLASLQLGRLTGAFSFDDEASLMVQRQTDEGLLVMTLRQQSVRIVHMHGKETSEEEYFAAEPLDWTLLRSLLRTPVAY